MSEELSPTNISVSEWKRPYKIGASDAHLHAIGQISANYAQCEWTVHCAFRLVCGLPAQVAQGLINTTNMSLTGMARFVVHMLKNYKFADLQAAKDLAKCIEDFNDQSSTRHKIIHWQSQVEDGETATYSNLIKAKRADAPQTESWSLGELRNFAFDLVKILRPMMLNLNILEGAKKRDEINPDWLVPWSKRSP